MSRSGYSDECENLELYRASVDRALHGKRGQAFLRELAAALDAMPEKVLIADELINDAGQPCAIGAVCKARRLDVTVMSYRSTAFMGAALGIAQSMVAEIAFMNDEWNPSELPSERWQRMRRWVQERIVAAQPANAADAAGRSATGHH